MALLLDGEKIRKRRAELQIRQRDLATPLNTSESYVSRLERSKTASKPETIRALSKTLKCKPSDLMTEVDEDE